MTLQHHSQPPVEAREGQAAMLARLERMIARNPDAPLPQALLRKESLWKSLSPDLALRWAILAQAAGLFDLGLEVLHWVNTTHPDVREAWRGRFELLRALGREEDAAALVLRHPSPFAGMGLEGLSSGGARSAPTAAGKRDSREAAIEGPFEAMRREEAQLARYGRLFQGREDCFARQWVDRKAGTQGYVPVRRPLEAADIRDHVRGVRTYGIYLLQKDSRVRVAVIDADLAAKYRGGGATAADRDNLRREKTYLLERLPEISRGLGWPCLVEFSGGKGFHFWFFFAEPVAAGSARSALQQVVRRMEPDLSCFSLEVFPKQDQLAGKGLGNLVKLPLGLHRATGRRSFFVEIADRSLEAQLAFLERVEPIAFGSLVSPDAPALKGRVVTHPSRQTWAAEYPELQFLGERCAAIGQILAGCRRSRELSVREEKILLGTLGFLPRARTLLHHVLETLPDYNPHLVDYKLSRLRGTPLGCKRIHSLLNLVRDFCAFPPGADYAHPLLHWPEGSKEPGTPRGERCVNLDDALEELRRAIGTVQRFLHPPGGRPRCAGIEADGSEPPIAEA